MRHISALSLIFVLLLVLACANPAAALEHPVGQTADTSQITPDGQKVGFAPVIVIAGYVVGEECIYLLVASGVIVGVAATSKSVSPSDDLLSKIQSAWNDLIRLGQTIIGFILNQNTVTVYKDGETKYTDYLNTISSSYEDSKNKGVPAKNHDNEDKVGGSLLPTGDPYSSRYLFGTQTAQGNGCPKQLRYYGKNGKADFDIDYGHTPEKGVTFPHTHTWTDGVRAMGVNVETTDPIYNSAIWQRCKNYDYVKDKFK